MGSVCVFVSVVSECIRAQRGSFLNRSRGADLCNPFAPPGTDKATEAMMRPIWPKCVLSSDLASEVVGYE